MSRVMTIVAFVLLIDAANVAAQTGHWSNVTTERRSARIVVNDNDGSTIDGQFVAANDEAAPNQSIVGSLEALGSAQLKKIQIELTNGTHRTGVFIRSSTKGVVISDGRTPEQFVPASDVVAVWAFSGGTEKGAVAGLLIGSVIGFLMNYPGDCGTCAPRNPRASVSGLVVSRSHRCSDRPSQITQDVDLQGSGRVFGRTSMKGHNALVALTLSAVMLTDTAFGQELPRVVVTEELDRIAATTDKRIGVELAIGSRLFGRIGKRKKGRFEVIDSRGQRFNVLDEEVVAFLDFASGQRTAFGSAPPIRPMSTERKVWLAIAAGLGALTFYLWQLGAFVST